ncbi:AraC family transcriptional regulator [Ruminococcus sp. CLA-AA-H200]|uniref:AraC family transcriptional regulator n=1 Tax=Ruminococcus turbiniformis TaxID=2881258 RepID=A0ABS8G1L2_9FIRM|nr:AraC family transcriptional regulator [Ruminococcus turbiniformis]MCC2256195.1 AraC family transcriptional regulator [Ruminococcus turbiniformis]
MEYREEIKAAIDYIEQHLDQEIRVDDAAAAAGFSKYHFQRIFKNETGLSVYGYIQKRRLAQASALLLNTSMQVLDIAVCLYFESQEAFTRAFKKCYGLPPGQYRKALRNVIHGGMNMENKNTKIKHWIITGTVQDKYETGTDYQVFHVGTRSAFIRSTADEYEADEYYTVMQQFAAERFLGKRVRFAAFVKAQDVEGWAGLWMRLDGKFNVTLKLDNMQNRPIRGTSEWNLYSCVLDVPPETEVINIGILLSGKGCVWMDNTSFQEVDRSVPVTEFEIRKEYPDGPENMMFEE